MILEGTVHKKRCIVENVAKMIEIKRRLSEITVFHDLDWI